MAALLLLFPITLLLFVVHEVEEIVLFGKWFDRNGDYLKARFSTIGRRMNSRFDAISARGFALIAAEETLLLILLMWYTIFSGRIEIFTGMVLMLNIHWLLTVVQSAVLRRMIPGTVTSIAGLVFGIFTVWLSDSLYPDRTYVLWGAALFVFAMANLWLMHGLVARLNKNRKT